MQQYVNNSGFDIDEKLNEIIFKHHLDEVYPDYKKMLEAEKLAKELAKSWISKGKIACIVTYESDIHLWKHFLRDGQKVEFIRCAKKMPVPGFNNEYYDVEKKLGATEWEKYSEVYVLSLEGSSIIQWWLRTHGVEHVFIYDYFDIHGCHFSKDWDNILMDPAMEYWTYRYGDNPKKNHISIAVIHMLGRWKYDKNPDMKQLHWRKSFFLALYIRDFVLAEMLIKNVPVSCEQSVEAWKEITVLIEQIKARIQACTRKDILMLWTDAVPYDDIWKIPFLKEKMKTGVCFDNMFSVNRNTNPTFKALLCHKLPVDEDSYSIGQISRENSIVLRDLEENGYSPVVIGGSWSAVPATIQSDKYHRDYTPTSMILWDLWRNILLGSSPCYFLTHSLTESHSPYLSMGVEDYILVDDGARYSASCGYLDKQYHYYLDTLPENMVKIFMTDHGKEKYQTRFHAFFVVENREPPRRVVEMCSYYDFFKLLRQIMKGETIDEREFAREFVRVQDLDLYSPVSNARIIKYRIPVKIQDFGYHGVIDKDYIYLKFTNGIEWLAQRGRFNEEPDLFGEHIADKKQLEKYRMLMGKIPEPSAAIKNKLRYAEYLRKVYENAKERNKVNVEKKCRLLNGWVSQYGKGMLAIRTGGLNAVFFYNKLSPENQERIAGFIDRDPNCSAAWFGKPVFSDVQSVPSNVKGILLVSYILLPELREEVSRYPDGIEALDPYLYLDENEISYSAGIAEYEMLEEDYDVGFPFDEIDEEI